MAAEADACADRHVGDRGAAGKLLARTQAAFHEVALVRRQLLRGDFDGAAQCFGIHVGAVGLGDRHRADEAGRESVERESAAAALGRDGAWRRQVRAGKRGAGKVGIETADVDPVADAAVRRDRHAGQARDDLAGVEVGQAARFFDRDGLDDVGRGFLLGTAVGGGMAGDDDVALRLVCFVFIGRCERGRGRRTQEHGDEYRALGARQGRTSIRHDDSLRDVVIVQRRWICRCCNPLLVEERH